MCWNFYYIVFQALDIVYKKIKWSFSKWVFGKYSIEILATILIITILVLYYVQKIENKHNKQKKKQFNHQKKVVFK